MAETGDKEFDELAEALWWEDDANPLTRIGSPPNPETGHPGGYAYFPRVINHPPNSKERQEQEKRWEESAIRMHENQTSIVLPPKPKVNELEARKRRELLRGD